MPLDPRLQPYFDANRANWDDRTRVHEPSEGYDRAGFLRGQKPLTPVEVEELAPLVAGKTLLHLQCHFGMDTLSLARLGATVTGLDLSPAAIEAARRLSAESGVPGRFVEGNVYDAGELLSERFDVVYTGIGALNWLPDIRAWARVAASLVKPGGLLWVYDRHPMLGALDDLRTDATLVVQYPYFETAEPMAWDDEHTYTDGPPLQHRRSYAWNHGLGELITAIIEEGLHLDYLHEHREIAWQALPQMVPASPRMWALPGDRERLPLMFSLRATRPID